MSLKIKKSKILIVALISVVFIAIITYFFGEEMMKAINNPDELRNWIDDKGILGICFFGLMVIVQIITSFIPGEPFELFAGYAFGVLKGTIIILIFESIGSLLVLLISRKLGNKILNLLFSKEDLDNIKFLRTNKKKFLIFSLIFILPGTPKDLLCYYAGITNIQTMPFMIVTTIGRLPSILTSTLGADALGDKNYLFSIITFALTAIASLVGLIIYKKISEHNKKSIKLTVVDMDGTLYYLGDLVEENFECIVTYLEKFKNYSREDAKKFLIGNGVYPYLSKDAKSTTQLFTRLGFDIKHWDEYRSACFSTDSIKLENCVNKQILQKLRDLSYVILLTNNTPANVELLLNKLNLSKNDFDEIFTNDQQHKNLTKQNAMEEIIKKYDVTSKETLAIGDRYSVDVLPMLNLKGKGIVINDKPIVSFKKIIKDFNNFKSCDEYTYYKK